MEDREIIKALECCIKECDYEHCPYYVNDRYECGDNFNKDILDLINRQKAEIKRLTVNMNAFGLGMKREAERADTARAEAVKEFAHFLIDKSENGVIAISDLPDCVVEFQEAGVESG